MAVKKVDVRELGRNLENGGQRLLNGPNFQMWVTTWKEGRQGRMHCHNCAETLYVIDGEMTVHQPDGSREVLRPGMAVMITGGAYYRLENSGPGKLVYLGHNPKPTETMRTIEYDTKKDHDPNDGRGVPPRFTVFN
jgi:mannose-6-phosphate isomerase-like protein (cupin superfamily)